MLATEAADRCILFYRHREERLAKWTEAVKKRGEEVHNNRIKNEIDLMTLANEQDKVELVNNCRGTTHAANKLGIHCDRLIKRANSLQEDFLTEMINILQGKPIRKFFIPEK